MEPVWPELIASIDAHNMCMGAKLVDVVVSNQNIRYQNGKSCWLLTTKAIQMTGYISQHMEPYTRGGIPRGTVGLLHKF